MKRLPLDDDSAPIVCTVGAAEVPDRIAEIGRMRAVLRSVERTDDGLLLRFPDEADIVADVRRFVADEARCCQFWGFAVAADATELTLRWDGPPGSSALLDGLLAYFEGDGSLGDLAGLP